MKTELLEKLLDAGFTKDEIIQLARDEPITKPEVNPEPEKKPEPETKPETNPEPEQKPEPEKKPEITSEPAKNDETEKRLTSIEKNISDLVKAIQLQNSKHDSFNNNPDSLEDQTDKIMESIIRPEPARKDEKK